MKKPTVCLIIANAHGGSTITNMIIGQHPAVFSAGTLGGFPDNGHFDNDNVCSCGKIASKCRFWSVIMERYKSENVIEKLYHNISKLAEKDIIVDVDHGTKQLKLLSCQKNINLKVLLVRRNKYAIVNSRIKKDRKAKLEGGRAPSNCKRLISTLVSYYRLQNRVAFFCKQRNVSWVEISYENLCRKPGSELQKVGALLDVDYKEVADSIKLKKTLVAPKHLIRGNRNLRAKIRSGIVVNYDDSFKKEMKPFLKICVNVVSFFVYPLAKSKILRNIEIRLLK